MARYRSHISLYSSVDDDLTRYALKNIEKIEVKEPAMRYGSDAEIIELNWNGTRCVGKKLHPIFFQEDTDPAGMKCLEKKFCKEIKLLSGMKHPNVVQFLGLYYPPESSAITKRPIMVMEKMNYSLTEYLRTHRKGSVCQGKVVSILSDVARGLIYLHVVQEIAHRDLSSNNILVTETLNSAKIADFGSARIMDNQSQWMVELTTQPGTQDFMPPEALEDPPRYDLSVDVFSFGCVIIHLTTHKWPKPSGQTAYSRIISEWDRRYKLISEMEIYNFLQPIVEKCLKNEPHLRPSSKKILSLLEDIPRERSASQPATPQSNHLYAADLLTMVPGMVQSTGMEASLPDISSYGSMMPVSSNLDVFDKAIQCIRELERKIDQQDIYIHDQKLHSADIIERLEHECDTNKAINQELNRQLEQMAQINRRLEEELKQVKVEHERVQTEQDEVIAKQDEDLDKLNKKCNELQHDYRKVKNRNDMLTQTRFSSNSIQRGHPRHFHSTPIVRAHQPLSMERLPIYKPERIKRENYDVTHKEKLNKEFSSHQHEPQKRQPNWSTVAVIRGNPGRLAEDYNDDDDEKEEEEED